MQTIIYSDKPNSIQQYDKDTTILIEGNKDELLQHLDYLRDNKFSKFQAKLSEPSPLNLKNLTNIVRVLVPEQGELVAEFQEISEQQYKKLINVLQAVGLENRNMNNPHELTKNIVFYKKQWGQSAKLDNVQQDQQTQQKQQIQVPVTGQYNFDKTVEIAPEQQQQQQKQDESKAANPFEQFASKNNNNNASNGNQTFIDENDLLKNDVLKQPVQQQQTSGSGQAPKVKACKNCTCGKKKQQTSEEKAELVKNLENGNVTSSCGNCYLGDAFRCASCPYKGLPSFKPGEKLKLDLDNNQDNQFNDGAQDQGVNTQGGTVKIQI